MGLPLNMQPFPRMWDIEPSGEPVLRIGQRRLKLSDIAGARREDRIEGDHWGVQLIGVLFVLAASGLITGVQYYGWRTRFLVGAAFLFALGLVSLAEAARAKMISYSRIRLETTSGEVLFTTADGGNADALLAALNHREN
jgi:hypothetical protein